MTCVARLVLLVGGQRRRLKPSLLLRRRRLLAFPSTNAQLCRTLLPQQLLVVGPAGSLLVLARNAPKVGHRSSLRLVSRIDRLSLLTRRRSVLPTVPAYLRVLPRRALDPSPQLRRRVVAQQLLLLHPLRRNSLVLRGTRFGAPRGIKLKPAVSVLPRRLAYLLPPRLVNQAPLRSSCPSSCPLHRQRRLRTLPPLMCPES